MACSFAPLPSFMTKNPILDDLHKTRERLLAEAGGTLEGLVAQLQQDERQAGREFIRPKGLTSKRCTGAVDSDVVKIDDQLAAAGDGHR